MNATDLRERIRLLSRDYFERAMATSGAEHEALSAISWKLWDLYVDSGECSSGTVTPLLTVDVDEAAKEMIRESVIESLAMDALSNRPEEI